MKVTIMITDTFIRFRLGAISHSMKPVQRWDMEVMSMVKVGRILHWLGFISAHDAYRLGQASTTIVPLEGFNTMPMADVSAVCEFALPDDEELAGISDEAKQGYMMFVIGDTTEEALATAGFVLVRDGPVQ